MIEWCNTADASLLANVLAPYVAWGIGGDESLSFPYSMMATLLAAFVERPFTKWSGVEWSPLRYSIRANIVSWMVGVLIVYLLVLLNAMSFFFGMYALAIPFSVAIEGFYLQRVHANASTHGSHSPFLWTPILIGNVVSGLLLLIVLFVGLEAGDWLQMRGDPIVTQLVRYKAESNVFVLTICSLVFLWTMLASTRSRGVAK